MKEMHDKQKITLEDNKKPKMKVENRYYKDQMGKMKKTVSEANKVSDELKKTNETLNIATNRNDQLQAELEETKGRLRAEGKLTFDQDAQLRRLTQEKVAESQVNDMLRAKLLHNDYKKYSEILGQKQSNNQRMIQYLRGSPELARMPQVQLALSTLDELSARLLVAGEELTAQYESLVRQLDNDKSVKELNFNVARFEPPNFGPSFLSLLQSYSIMNQASSAPLPFTATPPPPIPRPSPAASPA